MKTGMLWLDADTRRTFDEKVQRAVDYYQQKYGVTPDLCLVNTISLTDDEKHVGTVTIQRTRTVSPHHFWVGLSTN
ncbi:MAG: hypothetical protein LC131_08585 [Anaerolineae bacterium]|nr:hypothetical protein [Promineifilum sp.]MCZ2113877.1 hypothetical protein [Anaerolineae bacterium]